MDLAGSPQKKNNKSILELCANSTIYKIVGACGRTRHNPEQSVSSATSGLINSAPGSIVLRLHHL